MKCGHCPKTDGKTYLSNPPKVKCDKTGRFHFYDDECDCNILEAVSNAEVTISFGVCCMICDETIPFTPEEALRFKHSGKIDSKICDKCREAVLYIRKQLNQSLEE